MSLVALGKSLRERLGRNVAVVMHGEREASAVWWGRSPHGFFFFSPNSKTDALFSLYFILFSVMKNLF